MKNLIKELNLKVISSAIAAAFVSSGALATISQEPLFLSTSVAPNVMLLLDNSGSMETIIWDENYDPNTSYTNWGNGWFFTYKFNLGLLVYDPPDPSASISVGQWSSSSTNLRALDLAYCADGQGPNSLKRLGIHSQIRDIYYRVSNGNLVQFTEDLPEHYLYGRKVVSGVTTHACIRVPAPLSYNTRYDGNYLNYLFETYAVADSKVNEPGYDGDVPITTRIEVAKEVASEVVAENSSLRFGITQFNPSDGGLVSAPCGSPQLLLQAEIDALEAETSTPLAETYYEITRYFRGKLSAYNGFTPHISPIQYRCQKNFVIAITDGFPTNDTDIPPTGTTEPGITLPDFDGLSPATAEADFPNNMPQYSDGFQPSGSANSEGYALYLDDLALFAQEDMLTSGVDLSLGSFQDPDFPIQNLNTYTVGLALDMQMLQDAAEYGEGQFFRADNSSQLSGALNTAISDILDRTSSGSSVSANTARVEASSLIFQARFHSADWAGEVKAIPLNSDGSLGTELWNAADQFPAPDSRNLYTIDPTTGFGSHFLWNSLTPDQQASLNTSPADLSTDALGELRLRALRGEQYLDASFRYRSTPLGDIINSDPVFVGTQDHDLSFLPGTEGSTYRAFVRSKYTRTPALFVGANDGMMHGFDTATGSELFGYVPNNIFDSLKYVIDPGFIDSHRYLVDGMARVVDSYYNGAWHSTLIGSTGAGGTAVFALDVTDPSNMDANSVLWEVSADTNPNLGVSIPQPTIARMANGKWVAIVANGYESAGHTARMTFIDLETGVVIRELDTKVGLIALSNGMSSPTPVDVDSDRITDLVYAGDLYGNVWKIDVSSNDPADWDFAHSTTILFLSIPEPLFTACRLALPLICDPLDRQPITGRIEVGANPTGGTILYFGTGTYYQTTDNIVLPLSENAQSFYGIYDENLGNDSDQVGNISQLTEQTVLINDLYNNDRGGNIRITSDLDVPLADRGWFIRLPNAGERQVSKAALRKGRVVFTTVVPSLDPCIAGGSSYLMELDAVTGGRFSGKAPFDTNDDGLVNDDDKVTVEIDGLDTVVTVSGVQSAVGIIKTPGIVEGQVNEYKYTSGTTGEIETLVESVTDDHGRLSWRQIK